MLVACINIGHSMDDRLHLTVYHVICDVLYALAFMIHHSIRLIQLGDKRGACVDMVVTIFVIQRIYVTQSACGNVLEGM